MRTNPIRVMAFWAVAILPCLAMAQQRPTLPSTVQPGAVERERATPQEPAALPVPPAPIQPLPTQEAPPNAVSLTFALHSLDVTDAKVIRAIDLVRPYSSLIGKTISVKDVYDIANAMTVRYRNAGYILSSVIVPPQSVTDGRVTLRAVEGYIANVRFEGYQARSSMLQKMSDKVTADRPLRNATLERFLLLLNDLPRVTAQGVLQPSDTPGAADLIVHTHIYHAGGSLSGSNRGSRLEGPNQYQASVDLDSVLGLYDSTSLQYLQASRATELRLYAATHSERLTASGLELTFSASHSEANPALAGELAALNLATDTTQGSAELSFPIIRTRATNLSVRGDLTFNDSKSASFSVTQTQDKISALRLGMNADHIDAFSGVESADMQFSHGIHALGSSPFGDPFASRLDGQPDFWKVTAYLARLQSLSHGFSALLAFSGQYAFEHLLTPEEFAYGGEFFGRAYDPSELVGDSGVAGKFELRYTIERSGGYGATLYGFAEDGKVWTRRTMFDVGVPTSDSAVSVGGGVRVTITTWFSGYLETAKPTNHIVAAVGNQDVRFFGGFQISVP